MRVPAALILTAATSCSFGAPVTRPDPEREAVLAELGRYYADFSAREWGRLAEHFWPGATMSTIWAPPGEDAPRVVVTSVPEFVRQAPQGPGSKPIFEERMTSSEVRVHGTVALGWCGYEAKFGEPGKIATWPGVDAFALVKSGDRWKIAALAYTPGGEKAGGEAAHRRVTRAYGDLSAREWDTFTQDFWPGASVAWAGRGAQVKIMSIGDFIERQKQALAGKAVFGERSTSAEVLCAGDLAVVWSKFEGRVGDDAASARTWTGVDCFTLLRHNGEWRVVSIAVAQD